MIHFGKATEVLADFFSEKTFGNLFKEIPNEVLQSENTTRLACACSGGADSLCLLLLLLGKFPALRTHLVVLHYDHALREESADDANFVRKVCADLGVEFVHERRSETESTFPQNESTFRRLRLDFFERVMRERRIRILVQGHQRDDIAESMLMRLSRGAGTEGLAAPRPVSHQADGRIFVRPFLSLYKKEILAALTACEIPWREDKTNAGTDYFRNRVRNTILPELKNIAPFENFSRSRRLAEEDADALNFFAESLFSALVEKSIATTDKNANEPATTYFFNAAPETLQKLPALTWRVLRKIFSREKLVFSATTADALVQAITNKTPLKMELFDKKIYWNGIETLCFSPKNRSEDVPEKTFFQILETAGTRVFQFSPTAGMLATGEIVSLSPALLKRIFSGDFSPEKEVFLSLEKWRGDLVFLRAWTAGERIRPLGSPGEKTIGDAFTDRKVPVSLRTSLPVFADADGAAWIPGIPPANRLRLSGTENLALRLTYGRETLPL